jgi:phytoene synthase
MIPSSELRAAGITDPALVESYRLCRRINAAHGKTYFLATLLLPPAKRPYVHALYGFARHVDDILDVDDDPVRFESWPTWTGEPPATR